MGSASFAKFYWWWPIENSIHVCVAAVLAHESGQTAGTQRVIRGGYGDRVVMEDTMPEAWAAVVQGSSLCTPSELPASRQAPPPASEVGGWRVRRFAHYQRAIERLHKAGTGSVSATNWMRCAICSKN